MNNGRNLAILGIFALGVMVLAGQTKLEKDMTPKIKAYCAAVIAKDTAKMTKLVNEGFDKSFQYIDLKGNKTPRDTWLQREIGQVKACTKITKMEIKTSYFSEKGARGSAWGEVHFAGLMGAEKGQKPFSISFNGLASISFVKKNSKWLISEIRESNPKQLSVGHWGGVPKRGGG